MRTGRKPQKVQKGQIALHGVLGLYALACLLPVLLILIVSFSSEASINSKGFSFFPDGLTLEAYRYMLKFGGQVLRSYFVTIYETACGTMLSLLLCSMLGYALSRKDFALRGFLSVFLLITMLFNGGLFSNYVILSQAYHLRNNLLVLILPGAVSAFNIFIFRTFITANVPDSLVDAAKIDGAGEFRLFFVIVFPVLKPVLAAIGFMLAVGHWNEWQTAFLYIDDSRFATLQLMLIRIEKEIQYLLERINDLSPEEMRLFKKIPNEATRMAILMVTLGPIMFAYPFFQKHFVKGITIGAVKG
ncbi:MAG: carbohydrate ABC transporter permease [Clostridiales bacterium]|nr:carbohydrate ABC transporter permease [Clostridiales bacterium]